MRRTALIIEALLLLAIGCDDKPAATADAAPSVAVVATATAKPGWDAASMPPRPVPKSSPTVGSGFPPEVQMQAIGYMNAMAEPHSDDASVDSAFVTTLQQQLLPAAEAVDKGSKAERAKLATLVVQVGGGRRIDVLMVGGCEADTPKRLVQHAGYSLETLLIHGVLVIRCNDRSTQCLQSTRDQEDVLCTTAPRHK